MAPRRALDHAAVEADWHNRELTREQIAVKHRTSTANVGKIWHAAVHDRRLPDMNRLQFFKDHPNGADDIDADTDAAFSIEIDGVEPGAFRVPDGDLLLARLRKVHGNDPRRAFDDVVASDARMTPSPAAVAVLARFADRAALAAVAAVSSGRLKGLGQ